MNGDACALETDRGEGAVAVTGPWGGFNGEGERNDEKPLSRHK